MKTYPQALTFSLKHQILLFMVSTRELKGSFSKDDGYSNENVSPKYN